jgi:hypothetical protein
MASNDILVDAKIWAFWFLLIFLLLRFLLFFFHGARRISQPSNIPKLLNIITCRGYRCQRKSIASSKERHQERDEVKLVDGVQ